MAREIIVRTWCDAHLYHGEHVDGVELPPLALGPGKPRVLALCEVHRKELFDPLMEALTELGQPVDASGAPAPARRRSRMNTPSGGEFACPVEDCPYSGPTKPALQTHVRDHHDRTLADLEGAPAPFVCPECDRGFTTPQGMGAHRNRVHGVKGPKSKSRAAGAGDDGGDTLDVAIPATKTAKRSRRAS